MIAVGWDRIDIFFSLYTYRHGGKVLQDFGRVLATNEKSVSYALVLEMLLSSSLVRSIICFLGEGKMSKK